LEDGRPVQDGKKYQKALELNSNNNNKKKHHSVVILNHGKEQFYGLVKLFSDIHNNNIIQSEQQEESKHEKQQPQSESQSEQSKQSKQSKPDTSSNANIATTPTPKVTNPYAKRSNPYAKARSSSTTTTTTNNNNNHDQNHNQNPYATSTKSNPYAKSSPTTNTSTTSSSSSSSSSTHVSSNHHHQNENALWTDKYAPNSTNHILGNGENVRKLTTWLQRWEDTFNNPKRPIKAGNPNGPFKAALLSGPPGIGKTTTATLVAHASQRQVVEFNASDTRSKKQLESGLGDITGSKVLNFHNNNNNNNHHSSKTKTNIDKKRCIIMDEVDGMGAGDRSGISQLIQLIKNSKVPIICICNDRQSPKIRSLVAYCLDLRYRRPVKSVIARRAMEVARNEGFHVELNAAEAIAESCGNDIRQVLNCLQMWSNKKKKKTTTTTSTSTNSQGNNTNQKAASADLSYRDLKERESHINKDAILRVSMFDATKMIVEGRRGLSSSSSSSSLTPVNAKLETDSLYKRSEAFFVDYSLIGLLVHQNYIKVIVPQFQDTKRHGQMEEELQCIERLQLATESMSDFAVAENAVRSGDQLWGLLPLCSMLAVKTGHHIGGESGGFLPGFPEFSSWLGKNSSRGRKARLLSELSHHMNYKISADSTDLRLGYLPALRHKFSDLLLKKAARTGGGEGDSHDGPRVTEAIELMDEYGLDRDDLFENIDEFTLQAKAQKFSSLDSKTKSAFTREYNKGVHKSQALVDEQGTTTKSKKTSSTNEDSASKDLDVVNDDDSVKDESEDEEELDAEALKKIFKSTSKGKKTAANKGKKKGTTPRSKAKSKGK